MDIHSSIEKIKETLRSLSFTEIPDYPDYTQNYFRFYNINPAGVTHLFGIFRSSGYNLATHIFIPEQPARTVILMHGYYDHSGSLKHIISYLLSKNCSVAVYDMPGHGLSSGPECRIDRFETYGVILQEFMDFCQSKLKNTLHVITHSAGSVSIINLLLNEIKIPASSVILTAPLVHTKAYHFLTITSTPISLFTKKLRRKFNRSSSDPGFFEFLTHDPLQSKSVYLSWVKQLVAWNKSIRLLGPVDNRILIIQGDRDQTIDIEYNLMFLKQTFPNSSLEMIQGCGHQLLNEQKEIRSRIFSTIYSHITHRENKYSG